MIGHGSARTIPPGVTILAMHPPIHPALVLAFACAFLPAALHSQSVIYRETFGNSSATGSALGSISVNTSWKLYSHDTATDRTASRPVISPNATATGTSGLDNIGTGQNSTSTTNGIAYTEQPSMTYPYFFMTEGTAQAPINFDRTTHALSFEWYERNSNTTDGLRIAVRIGTSWYATNQLFTTEAGGGSATMLLQNFSFTDDGSAWRDLTFTAGTTSGGGAMSISSTARVQDLPEGNITGLGVFIPPHSNYVRFDNFTVLATAIPEPSSLALVTGLLALTGGLGRRRLRQVTGTTSL